MKTLLAIFIFSSLLAGAQSGFIIAPSYATGSAPSITNTTANDTSLHDTLAQIWLSGFITLDYVHKTATIQPILFTSMAAFNTGHSVPMGINSVYNVPTSAIVYSPASWPPPVIAPIDTLENYIIRAGYKIKATF